MKREVRRSILSGKILAPPSTAMAHRAILLATLCPGQTVVSNVPQNDGIKATIGACEAFGADIASEKDVVDVFGPDRLSAPQTVDCGSSNTTLKLFMPIAALFDSVVSFAAEGGVSSRPMGDYADYFGALSVSADAPTGYLPIKIKGPIGPGGIVYFPRFGSQFLSGLLLAAPLRNEDTSIAIAGKMHGGEYVEGTVELMEKSGITFLESENDFYYLNGPQPYAPPEEMIVPGSAYLSSFPLLAGALAGKAEVRGVAATAGMKALFSGFCAKVDLGEGKLSSSISALEGAQLDAEKLGQYLVHALVLASTATGETRIANAKKLKGRQERRMRLMVRELMRMGAKISETEGGIAIVGGKLSGAEIEPEGDPKVAMACSVAAIAAQGPSMINDAECIGESYPGFFSDLAALGAIIR